MEENCLLLSVRSGWYFDKDLNNPAGKPACGGGHGASPLDPQLYTGLIAWGAAISHPAKTGKLMLTDMFPLLKQLIDPQKENYPIWTSLLEK